MRSSVLQRSAFVPHDLTEPIKGRSDGPLAGLTAAVKDMYDIAGYRTGAGNPEWLASRRPAETHADAVQKLLDAGATITGKTVCDEFFYSITGANAHYGTPVNPRAPGRLPGGSSSGSAAACAAGACDLALGSDTAGSVRVPAALCGVYGIRATQGRFDMGGATAMAPSFDAGGWFSASPGLLRRAGAVLLESPQRAAPVTQLTILDDAFETVDPRVATLVDAMVAAAQDRISAATHDRAAPKGLDTWREAMRIVQAHEVWASFGEFITKHRPNLGPGIRERMEIAARIPNDQVARAHVVTAQATQRMDELVVPGTVLAMPTAPSIAPPLATPADELESFRVGVMRLVCMASISGLPQLTIPAGTADGAPVGLSFIGWRGGDEALLSLATAMAPLVGTAL
ncbi:MAG: amidase [Thermoleophilaceae bacterium]|nr:amidase [Thermoleophilaceae bacterium]